ncbi:MAG: PilZ domain-containing protein [Pseudomonadota bacterium]
MNDVNDNLERRKHERLKAKEGTFAVVTSGNRKLGQVKDISMGGLTFQYVDNGEPVDVLSEVELFSAVYDFHLKKLKVKSVEDLSIDNTVSFSSLPMRQLRIQFGTMTSDQSRLLDFFLRKHTQQ